MKHKKFTRLVEDEGRLDWALLREALKYNPDTGNFTSALHSGVKVRGTFATGGYLKVCFDGKVIMAHRLAWFYVHGVWPHACIDHINRHGTDNRISNLRVANHCENGQNLSLSRKNS